MKIGILRPPAGIGGAETTLLELYYLLKKNGFNPWISFNKNDGETFKNFVNAQLFEKKFEIITKEKIVKNNIFDEEYAIKNIKDSDLIIILHYRFFSKKIKNALNKVKNKVVYVPGKNSAHVTSCINDPSLNVDNFIFNSKETLEHHNNLIYNKDKNLDYNIKNKFIYLHPPMAVDSYVDVAKIDYKEYRLNNFNIPKNEFSIGVIGRVQPSKEPFEAISIFKKMEEHYNYDVFPRKLYFIGAPNDDDYLNNVIDYSEKSGIKNKIIITGFIEDPRFYIRSMDCILHCCKMESLSRSIRESMILKKPVIGYNNFGNKTLFGKSVSNFLYNSQAEATSLLVKIGSSGKRKRNASNNFFTNIKDLEISHSNDYFNFIKGFLK